MKRTAVAALGAIGTDKDPQRAFHTRAVQFKSCLHRRIFLSLNAGIFFFFKSGQVINRKYEYCNNYLVNI